MAVGAGVVVVVMALVVAAAAAAAAAAGVAVIVVVVVVVAKLASRILAAPKKPRNTCNSKSKLLNSILQRRPCILHECLGEAPHRRHNPQPLGL